VTDYRGPEFHEPTPEVVPYLMEVWDSTYAKLILFGLAWLRSIITMFVMYLFTPKFGKLILERKRSAGDIKSKKVS